MFANIKVDQLELKIIKIDHPVIHFLYAYEMADKEYLRKYRFVHGWSIREISRRCKISRQTVLKFLVDAEFPGYRYTKLRPRPVVMERLLRY